MTELCTVLRCDELAEAWIAYEEHRAEHRGEVCCAERASTDECDCGPCGECVARCEAIVQASGAAAL